MNFCNQALEPYKRHLKKTKEQVDEFFRHPNGEVFFFSARGGSAYGGDEGRFGLKSTITRIWAKRGTDVKIKKKGSYKSFYVYSSVSPSRTGLRNLFLPEVNTAMMNIYLRELSKEYSDKEITMIMDQAGWYKSKELEIPSNIKLLFLPPYS